MAHIDPINLEEVMKIASFTGYRRRCISTRREKSFLQTTRYSQVRRAPQAHNELQFALRDDTGFSDFAKSESSARAVPVPMSLALNLFRGRSFRNSHA